MKARLREKDLLVEIDRLKKIVAELKTSKPYGLVWEDKPEQFEKDAANAVPVLKPKGGKFRDINFDPQADHNVLIEGDNYHALSVLSYTHKGKIDVIYIDPPYNTGKQDFRYNDEFVEPDDVYRHSKWLSFMEKRLRLAHTLLKEGGVIFISIDDNEQAPLRLLCDAIFSANNFLATIVLKNKAGAGAKPTALIEVHEYILMYAKQSSEIQSVGLPYDEANQRLFTKRDKHFPTKGPYGTWALATTSMADRPNLRYAIKYNDEEIWPEKQWLWSKDRVQQAIKNEELVFNKMKNGKWSVRFKRYLKDELGNERQATPTTFFDGPYTHEGTRELTNILGERSFIFPKPVNLIKKLLQFDYNARATTDALVLDFFAGSGTTGQAVLDLNKNDGGNRRFILVTNNENNICEDVTFERLKRVMKGYKTSDAINIEGLGGNLAYLKTDFVAKELAIGLSDEAKLKLTHRANLLLSLKENTFTPLEATDHYEITSSPTNLTAVYFREDKSELESMLDKLLKIADAKPVTVYIFAWEKGAYKTGIPGYPFDFQDIPEPIVELYQSIGY
jgi:adenine-specific DNA-methyltransferase